MLWRRDFLAAHGGAKALAGEIAEDAAATKLVRRAGLRVRVVGQPFEQPLGERRARDVWSRQVRWARLRRGTFPHLFALEIFAGALLPLIACAFLAAALGYPPLPAVLALAIAWYGAEAALARAAGWHFDAISFAASLIRDVLLPAIWLAGWAGKGFEWRGNSMRIVESKQSALTRFPPWRSPEAARTGETIRMGQPPQWPAARGRPPLSDARYREFRTGSRSQELTFGDDRLGRALHAGIGFCDEGQR
jgi:hypothetical protein